ncbi:asparaginase [Paenibacillus sp. UNC451MF]|uniref:asparaginase n=1 Tax=Paenibacillus sp. UNC451MF TaxID=1449063 RepID=UPI00048C0AF6|nr:asparaginase [Paenibacillus sp. UNC451MF]
MSEILVEELRGGLLECQYAGHICGVDESGSVRYKVGNAHHMTYLRSAAKPIQAIPSFRYGIAQRYPFTEKELAIMTASHRSEPFHVTALESMMDKIGLSEEHLACHATYPLNTAALNELVTQGKPERRLYHNCSGKHLGILAYCKSRGFSLSGYDDPKHPVQQEIVQTLAMLSEYPAENIHIGVDGCGFPVFAIPLYHLALAYLKLGCPDLIGDKATRVAVEEITALMNRNFEMVAGTDMICSTLLSDDNIVAKGGAKGVYCFGLRKERLAFALKVMDGSEDKWPMIVAAILEQIGYDRKQTIDELYRLCPKILTNGSGTIVGENRAVFQL